MCARDFACAFLAARVSECTHGRACTWQEPPTLQELLHTPHLWLHYIQVGYNDLSVVSPRGAEVKVASRDKSPIGDMRDTHPKVSPVI